ncbi:MAG: hypothetical protein RTV41_12995 [Candidatus Thorarchaeota archaeon]
MKKSVSDVEYTREASKYRPKVHQLGTAGSDLLKILSVVVLVLVLTLPVLSADVNITNVEAIIEPTEFLTPAVGGPANLLHIGLSGSYRAHPGSTMGMRGFAYVNYIEGRVFFTDPFSDTTLNMSIAPSVTYSTTLIVSDVDDDGHDEFLGIRRPVPTTAALFIADFNDDTLTEWTFPGVSATILGLGDFNGDTQLDASIVVNGGDWMITLDLSTGSVLGTYDVGSNFRSYSAIGRFSDSSSDQIVLSNDTHIWLFDGDGSGPLNMSTPTTRGIYKFDYGGGLSDFFLVDNLGHLRLYQGSDLSLIYQTTVSPVAGQVNALVGNFTGDSQEDIVAVSTSLSEAQFIDGSNGTIIRTTPEVYSYVNGLASGYIDNDDLIDVALVTTFDNPCFIHGHNADIAYVETFIEDVDTLKVYDVDANGLDDIFINSGSDLYILLSEPDAPIITEEPLNPLHPTVEDEFVAFEISMDETTAIESAELYIREEGTLLWTQPHIELFTPDGGESYFAFLVGLEAAVYEYYVTARDVYLNVGYSNNETHPGAFIITGHLAWEHDKSDTYNRLASHRLLAPGNTSLGNTILYNLELLPSGKTLALNKFAADGTLLDSYGIDFTGGYSFTLSSGLVDDDTILDPIAIVSTGSTIVYVLHGNDFTLYHQQVSPVYLKTINLVEVLDGNADGKDDVYLLENTDHYTLARMDSSGSWTFRVLPDPDDSNLAPQFMIGAFDSDASSNNLTIVRGHTFIEITDGSNISLYSSIAIPRAGFTKVEAKAITTMDRLGPKSGEFAFGLTFWTGTTPETRMYLFDGSAQSLGDMDTYFLAGMDVSFLHPFDVEQDGVDELVVLDETGELVLARVLGPLSVDWAIPVTDASPLSGLVTDFDGDDEDEFILFTKEDGGLTAVSAIGEIERTASVGEVYVPIPIGNVDPGEGQEIAAYPLVQGVGDAVIGAIRDLDWFYRMTAIFDYSPWTVEQGTEFSANVTVTNIYGEIVEDASVYMSAHYMTPEGPGVNTYGFYFDWPSMKYQGSTDASWPIGLANLSISVGNGFYHPLEQTFVDAVTIVSNLHVSVEAPDLVTQGDGMNITIWVLDNLGGTVEDATVSVTIGGVGYAATPIGSNYIFELSTILLDAGPHIVSATADHAYAFGTGVGEAVISVQILTTSLNVLSDFPAVTQQDDLVTAWFNITDGLGQPVEGAIVSLRSGPRGFELIESSVLGSYIFSHNMTLGIGSQIFDLVLEKPGIIGPPVTDVTFEVFGNLTPNVFYNPRVEGGAIFDVTVFVKDKYGPVFNWTIIQVDINGTLYPAYPSTIGLPEYTLLVTADFLLGPGNFTVYVNATHGNPWAQTFDIRTYSDAATSSEVISTHGWVLTQGDSTTIELHFVDWTDRPIGGASVTVFVKALSYNLLPAGLGVYAATISTAGWLPGDYEYVVSVVHPDVETGVPMNGTLRVMGTPEFFVTYLPETPIQGQPMIVNITVVDGYGNPIPDLDIFIEMMGLPPMQAYATDQVGAYVVEIPAVPTTEGYGDFTLAIIAIGEFVGERVDMSNTVTISPATPNFAMSTASLSFGAGTSFVLSLIGMFIYFRMAASMKVDDKSLEGRKKSVRNMDRLYLLIVLASGAGLVGSYFSYISGSYDIALILTVTLLGTSVLLYGLWLYRDATSAVLVRGKLGRKRMALGLWHLVFVPLVIFMILLYGVEIDWFKAFIIDQSFVIGTIAIPTIMTTIFAAYISSILVVVINHYREVSKGIKKIAKMEDAGTPVEIVEDERTSMVSKFSSSIRVKFLMFLVVVGATTVMSMDFLASWELGIIVLLPVAFLVVIPFISSKIIQLFSRISRGRIPAAPVDV